MAAGIGGDARFATHGARGDNMAEIDAIVGTWTATLPCHEVLRVLDAHGVPGGRIFTAPDMLSDPQYLAREMILETNDADGRPLKVPGVVPKLSATPGALRHPAPRLGQHTDECVGRPGWPARTGG